MTRRWIWFSAILLLAAALRIVNLDALPLWIDEGFSYLAIKSPDLLTALVRDVHPPLYFVLLKLWAGAAGVSEFALRYPSALLGVLSAALIVPLAREIVWLRGSESDRDQRRMVPLLAALLLAVSEMGFYIAQEVRSYSLHLALAIFSTWMLLRWIRRGGRVPAALWIVGLIALLYTHYLGAWTAVVQALYALAVLRGRRRWVAFGLLTLAAAVFAAWLLVVVLPYQTVKADSDATIDPSTLATLVSYAQQYLTGQWALMLGLFVMGLVHVDDGKIHLRPLRASLLLLAWITVPVALTFAGNLRFSIMTNYRLSQIIIPLVLIWALGLAAFRPPVRAFLVAVVVIYGVFSTDFGKLFFPWDDYATRISDYAAGDDVVLMDFKGVDFSVEYYLDEQLDRDVDLYSLRQIIEWTPDELYDDLIPALNTTQTVWVARWNDTTVALDLLRDAGLAPTYRDLYLFQGNTVETLRFDRLTSDAPPLADYVNGLRLLDIDVDAESLHAGMLWTVDAPLDAGYTLSVFLLDSSGRLVAQHDAPPSPPTDTWQSGAVMFTPMRMTPVDGAALPVGEYQVGVKVYLWQPDGLIDVLTGTGDAYAVAGTVTIPAR
jgi:hypothetical protein